MCMFAQAGARAESIFFALCPVRNQPLRGGGSLGCGAAQPQTPAILAGGAAPRAGGVPLQTPACSLPRPGPQLHLVGGQWPLRLAQPGQNLAKPPAHPRPRPCTGQWVRPPGPSRPLHAGLSYNSSRVALAVAVRQSATRPGHDAESPRTGSGQTMRPWPPPTRTRPRPSASTRHM